ncbi:MAG TPA: 2-oxo acid dehydrogenase subunit E2 [Ktedonobacterales bacterium]|nr:2-oxo acid dehydrogenase subunit E2 [Ktedonobacterales bacterium]
MRQQHADYQVAPYQKLRQFSVDMYRSVRHKPLMHGLIEVDVTRARAALRVHKAQTGESLSFTAFLSTCLAKAVDEHKAVQAFRKGKKQLVLFKDVDILARIERDVGGEKYVMPYVIRAANRKTVRQIHNEIRAAQLVDMRHMLTQFWYLPTMLFKPFIWTFAEIGKRRPQLGKKFFGTVGITSVGMFGAGPGWGIPPAMPTALMLTVGGIGEKQVMVDGHPAVREYLSLTISIDHDLVDGAPAARFTQRLKALIESGYGLDLGNTTTDSEQTPRSREVNHVYTGVRESSIG